MSEKRERFTRLANQRVNRAIDQLRLIGNLSNKSTYDYTDEDARKIVRALQKACDATKDRLLGGSDGSDKPFSL